METQEETRENEQRYFIEVKKKRVHQERQYTCMIKYHIQDHCLTGPFHLPQESVSAI